MMLYPSVDAVVPNLHQMKSVWKEPTKNKQRDLEELSEVSKTVSTAASSVIQETDKKKGPKIAPELY